MLQVPAFETTDGQLIAESNAIAYYGTSKWSTLSNVVLIGWLIFPVANQQLRGVSEVEQAQVIQWMNFGDGEILPLSCTIVFPILGIIQHNKSVWIKP